jgi:hypothetical protein
MLKENIHHISKKQFFFLLNKVHFFVLPFYLSRKFWVCPSGTSKQRAISPMVSYRQDDVQLT